MTESRTILFVITGLAFGGAEVQVVSLARKLRQRGWSVTVVSLMSPRAFVEELGADGVEVASLGMERGRADWRAVWKLREVVRRHRPQVVHSHMVHANLLARVTRILAPVPALVCTAHNTDEGAQWRYRAYRLTDPLCDFMTNVSEVSVQASIERGAAPAAKIQCIPNGVDLDRFEEDEAVGHGIRRDLGLDDHFLWLAIGRLEPQKDYPNMLRAFASLAERFRHARLAVVGDGPLRDDLATLANRLDIADRVMWLGIREDIPALLQAADAFVLSSKYEGLPMVLLEATASGLPVVATSGGGVAEIVSEDAGGLLVVPENANALRGAMEQVMMLTPAERAEWGRQASERTRARYSLDAVTDRWEGVYSSLVGDVAVRTVPLQEVA